MVLNKKVKENYISYNINDENVALLVQKELKEKVQTIFGIDDEEKMKWFYEFAENNDHWFEHSFHVYLKALEIAAILKVKWYKISLYKIFAMAFMHDSGRFHISEKNPKKRERCEKRHNKCGIAQVRLAKIKLQSKWILLWEEFWKELNDYIENHDFLNNRLDPNYKEPESIEWQIVRLSDRISTDIETEIERYWETWKRLHTPYFIEDISFEDRVNFNFTKVWEYIKSKKFDEFTFFLALISVSENDYINPDLQEIYKSWAASKDIWIQKILDIWRKEWFSQEQIEKMKTLINDYMQHFNINY